MHKILLTVDDAFSNEGKKLLDFLIAKNIGCVFFCTGKKILKNAENTLYVDALKSGYIIGNHSYSHSRFTTLPEIKQREEIEKTDVFIDKIYEQSGRKRICKFFRFPYGMVSPIGQHILRSYGYLNPFVPVLSHWLWDSDLKDGKNIAPLSMDKHVKECIFGVKKRERPCSIVLSHDCEDNVKNGLFEKLYDEAIKQDCAFLSNEEIRDMVRKINGRIM